MWPKCEGPVHREFHLIKYLSDDELLKAHMFGREVDEIA
jgi:hypothetical protein